VDRHLYRTGEFARKASVTVRTLRYYDKVGLLRPSAHTEAGYRLYTDEDLLRLQQILALKFLGFALDEIRRWLRSGPALLHQALAIQKAMMREKRAQLDVIITAIEETEALLHADTHDWEPIVHIIEVIQMQQTPEWVKKYFTDAQLRTMQELSEASYTDEDRQKLAQWGSGFSEADQQAAIEQWGAVGAELQRLVAIGADPAGAEAQALVRRQRALIAAFTHGDPGVERGLRTFYKNLGKLPAEQAPFAVSRSAEEQAFLQQAMAAEQGAGGR
jgi:MerR family transcriptional regulator, thiopeptide resistance regulator